MKNFIVIVCLFFTFNASAQIPAPSPDFMFFPIQYSADSSTVSLFDYCGDHLFTLYKNDSLVITDTAGSIRMLFGLLAEEKMFRKSDEEWCERALRRRENILINTQKTLKKYFPALNKIKK